VPARIRQRAGISYKRGVIDSAKPRVPLVLALFVFCAWLYTRHNDFPFFYHPDEPDKIAQLVDDRWNFHHPALMLSSAKVVIALFHAQADRQQIVIIGRDQSALYAAVAVSALALLAWRMRGPLAFAGVAIFAGLHHQVFELAHYFKEDAALLMGVALTFLALHVFWKKPCALAAAFLGVACGLSLSAKYVGIVMFVPALVLILRAPNHVRHLAVFASIFLATTAIANYPLATHLDQFKSSFSREVSLATEGQRGATHGIPNTEYFPIFAQNMNVALWIFLAVFVVRFWRERRTRNCLDWIFLVFPLAYALLLACSPKSNDRYFLPATTLFALLAAFGFVDTVALLAKRIPCSAALALCVAFAAIFQIYSLLKYDNAFAHDDRRELSDWIRANLPSSAVIAQDSRVGLPTEKREERLQWQQPLSQRVVSDRLSDSTLDDLRTQDVTHVVLSESDYGRYFRKAGAARDEYRGQFEQRRLFYERLRIDSELLWQRSRGTVIYLHPGLELYRLPPR